MRKFWKGGLAAFFAFVFVLTGCSGSKSPKEILQDALTKSAQIQSYAFSGSLKLEELDIPAGDAAEEEAQIGLELLKNAEISWNGAYRADPMLTEINLNVSVKGDLEMSFTLPIVMNQEKMWIKVPDIPMFPLPPDIVGKFVELDLKELAEEQDASLAPLPQTNVAVLQKLGNELMDIVFRHVDEKTYLSTVTKKEAGLPDSADAKNVVRFRVTKEQIKPFLQTFIENIAPEAIELLSKEEYRNALQLTQEELDEAKKQLESFNKDEFEKGMAAFDQNVEAFDVTANLGVNGDGYVSYTDIRVRIAGRDGTGQTGKIGLKLVTEQTDINKDVAFEHGVPEEVLTVEELMELFGAGMDVPM